MLTDSEYMKIKQIRKRHAAKMKELTVKMRKAAEEAISFETRMKMDMKFAIQNYEGEMPATFTTKGPLTGQVEADSNPKFTDVLTLADNVLSIIEKVEDEEYTVIVDKTDQESYAHKKLGITDFKKLPPNWNPATHYHCGDFRPLTPTTTKQQDPSEYETPAGSWVVKEENIDYLSETGEEVIYVPKAEHAEFARKKYGIKDFSIVPPEWNPSTHYRGGDFRPRTPAYNPMKQEDEDEESKYETPDGCWVVPLMEK